MNLISYRSCAVPFLVIQKRCNLMLYHPVIVNFFQMKNEAGEWQDAFDAAVSVFGLDMSDSTPAKW